MAEISCGVYCLPSMVILSLVPILRLMEMMVRSGLDDGLALGDLADEALAVLCKGDDGRRGARALGVGDDDGLAALHDGDAGIGGTKVNADDLAHN